MDVKNVSDSFLINTFRVESFIEHQDACNLGRLRSESQVLQQAACLSRTASSPSPSSDTNFSAVTVPNWPATLVMPKKPSETCAFLRENPSKSQRYHHHNLELQLSTATTSNNPIEIISVSPKRDDNHSTQLQLSIGSSDFSDKNELSNITNRNSPRDQSSATTTTDQINKPLGIASTMRLKEEAREQLRLAMVEKGYAEEARQQAKRQIELAEQEFANAKRIRQQAQAELDRAQSLKEHAIKQINFTILQVTCQACKQQFQARTSATTAISYNVSSSAINKEGGGELLESDNIRRTDHAAKSSLNPPC